MVDVLERIVAHKRSELEHYDFGAVREQALAQSRPTISMAEALRGSKKGGIIAEFKRRSPSRGWINEGADPATVVAAYAKAGAAACSVLTNEEFFGGSLSFLRQAREVAGEMPLLRKEFIIDPRQIYEARTAGADAVLLIAACLSVEQCAELAEVAHSVELEVLLEVHSEQELAHLNPYIDMLGVNNRNLGTFVTQIENSFRLAEAIKALRSDCVLVSESGIDSAQTIKSLQEVGFQGFLIGDALMRDGDPASAINTLIDELC